MGYASCIGRVGTLAAALGIGVGLLATPGVAAAKPSSSSSDGSSLTPDVPTTS